MKTPIRRPRPVRMRSTLLATASTVAILAGLLAGPAAAAGGTPSGRATAAQSGTASARLAGATRAVAPAAVTGTACSPSCDLYATTGSLSLPGGRTVTTWGYTTSNTPGSASVPGPVLVVNQGDPVSITLHNVDLPEATSLMISGQPGTPDTAGVTAGSARSYAWGAGALKPGTYLYEAGLTAGGPRQVALGMYGALIVRPTGCASCAYGTSTSFDDEALLVLGEVDPALNADPQGFVLNDYSPVYWLINGKAYPQTDAIPTAAGHTVLLRYVNAGLQHHSMGLLGLHQTVIARDGLPEANPLRLVAETVPTGGTLDALVSVPASPPANATWPLMDMAMTLHNDGLTSASSGSLSYRPVDFGGMLTFLTTSGGTAGETGPATSGVALSPNPSNGSSPVTLTATVSGSPDAAEYFVDTLAADGTGCAISGPITSISVAIPVSGATAPCADLTTLASGSHTFYVQAHDANGWGAPSSAVLNLDKTGPAVTGLSLVPNPTNGSADVALAGTASDAATGGQTISAAEYAIDGGTATAMTLPASPTVDAAITAAIPAATVAALTAGAHQVGVRAQDALGNWGGVATITLHVDKGGPTTTNVTATPNPNNGATGVQISTGGAYYLRIDATETANGASGIAAAEYFLDTVGPDGTGGAMLALDGTFNSTSEAVYAAVDLIDIANLAEGNHTISVHGRDAAGNWGPMATTVLVIDKGAPTVSGAAVNPAIAGTGALAVSANAVDPVHNGVASNIGGGEFFLDTLGAPGTGTVMTAATASPSSVINGTIAAATVAGLSAGTHTVYVRARDAAGNWSAGTSNATLRIDHTPPTFSSITLNPNRIGRGTTSITLTVNGASDGAGGSGVAGGEWWIGNSNITPGTGTAFGGLSTTVPTASLNAGTYTVRVRIRDAAGNWSTGRNGVRTATLRVTNTLVFANGFESGIAGWSGASTTSASRLSVTSGAALVGARGLRVRGNGANFVQRNFSPATSTLDARFYFNPRGNASAGQDIFAAATSSTFRTVAFHIRYRRSAGVPQVQIQVGGTRNAGWVSIANTSTRLEVTWTAGGTLALYVNGGLAQTLHASGRSLASVRLGSVTRGTSSTLMYFDAFSAKRTASPLVGR